VPPRADRSRETLARRAAPLLAGGERVVALFPFASTPRRPRRLGRAREGIWLSVGRYRPLVLTDRRLLVFDAARTPLPRTLLAEFPAADVTVRRVEPRSFGTTRVVLRLGSEGEVPFQVGRYERDDLAVLLERLGPPAGD
jgi:hypothetical protein